MPQKTLEYKDAQVEIHAGLFGGGVSIGIACRKLNRTFTVDEFMALVYPAIDAAAKAVDDTLETVAAGAGAPSSADLDAAASEQQAAAATKGARAPVAPAPQPGTSSGEAPAPVTGGHASVGVVAPAAAVAEPEKPSGQE